MPTAAIRKIKHQNKVTPSSCFATRGQRAIPGCLDDAIRADVARYYTTLLSEAGFGWMGWALREGIAISTRRDRYDGNGTRVPRYGKHHTQ